MVQITHFDAYSTPTNTTGVNRNKYYKVPVLKLVLFFLYQGK